MTEKSIRIDLETPPRMWGRLKLKVDDSEGKRNTPTHVGKTKISESSNPLMEKHPHACGEDSKAAGCNAAGMETPPRMWGRLTLSVKIGATPGNTPTHVGKTS